MWEVPKGRRDGLISQASLVQGRIPSSNLNIQQQAETFADLGLSIQDLVVLAGTCRGLCTTFIYSGPPRSESCLPSRSIYTWKQYSVNFDRVCALWQARTPLGLRIASR